MVIQKMNGASPMQLNWIRKQVNKNLHHQQYCYIVTDSSRQHKQMPDNMMIVQFFPEIKNNADAVQQSTNNDHGQYRTGNSCKKLSATEQQYPTHSDINHCWYEIEPAGKEYFEKENIEYKVVIEDNKIISLGYFRQTMEYALKNKIYIIIFLGSL